jgi:hypothetical protein
VRSRSLPLLAVAFLAIAAAACGTEAVPEELFAVPVQRAIPSGDASDALAPLPPERARDDEPAVANVEGPSDGDQDGPEASAPEPTADAAPDPEPSAPDPAEGEPTAEVEVPSDAAIARFVKKTTRGALDADHLVADVTGDGNREVLVGTVRLDGLLELVLGRWDGERVTEVGRVDHRDASDLGTLVVRDLDGDGHVQVLLPFVDRPRLGVLVADVARAGRLAVPDRCPVEGASRQTFDFGEGVEVVELGCASREVRGRDGLVWSDGVFLGAGAVGGGSRGRDG